jgi:hypothetical protein
MAEGYGPVPLLRDRDDYAFESAIWQIIFLLDTGVDAASTGLASRRQRPRVLDSGLHVRGLHLLRRSARCYAVQASL